MGCDTPRWPWEENRIWALKISSCKIKRVNMILLMLTELCDCFSGKKSTSLPTIDKRTKCLYTGERSKFAVSWAGRVVAFKMEILKDSLTFLFVPWYSDELLCEQKRWFLWSRLQWVRTTLPFHTSGAVWHLFGRQHSWSQPRVPALLFSGGDDHLLLLMPGLKGAVSSAAAVWLHRSQSRVWPSVWENLKIWLTP